MTSKQLYEGVQIEMNKENAPNILLEDFNHFANKAINQYINKRYNIYDINQQSTDDLRVLKATAVLTPQKVTDTYDGLTLVEDDGSGTGMATYYVDLPSDYLHLLNCICIYNVKKTYKCYNAGDTWRAAATRLTADAYSQVLDNFWLKPSYKRPYYYIHNINTVNTGAAPTNPWNGTNGTDSAQNITGFGKDGNNADIVQGSHNLRTITINGASVSNVERGQNIRYGNVSKVRLEIRYGTDNSVFTLDQVAIPGTDPVRYRKGGKVYIDYIKAPQHIRLTQKELDLTEDTSQMLEFPDYVCQEILNELVHLLMENISDGRLQTHPVVSQSIANPAQAQAPQAQGQTAQE